MEGKKSAFSIESILSNANHNNNTSNNCSSSGHNHQNNKIHNLYSPRAVIKREPETESYEYVVDQDEEFERSVCNNNKDRFMLIGHGRSVSNTITASAASTTATGPFKSDCLLVKSDSGRRISLCSPSSASTLLIDDADSTVDMAEDEDGVVNSRLLDGSHDYQEEDEDVDDNEDLCREGCRDDEDDQRIISGIV